MKAKQSYLIFFRALLLLGLAGFYGCTRDNICLTPTLINMRGGFYRADTSNTLRDSLQENAFILFGGTLYIQVLKKSANLAFPLSQKSDSVTFYFVADSSNIIPGKIDTISLFYQRELQFISAACGFQTLYKINQVNYSQQVIDSIAIATSEVNTDLNTEHIKIILKP
jgi:hypothetical protein